MSPLQFLCPCCDALLRMRPEQVAAVPEFPCPACHRPLHVVSDSNGITAVPVVTTRGMVDSDVASAEDPSNQSRSSAPSVLRTVEPRNAAASAASSTKWESAATRLDRLVEKSKAAPAKQPVKTRTTNSSTDLAMPWYFSPLVIAWASALGFAAVLMGYALWQNSSDPLRGSESVADAENIHGDAGTLPNSAGDKLDGGSGKKVVGSGSRERLISLGQAIRQQSAVNGSFPAGTWPNPSLPVERRFSWLAKLLEAQAWQPPVSVVWDRPWNDPLNEAFVRRRVSELQNPAIAQLTGGDGYPATHFVGMAGVGADAATLPADDPRAGIFGDNRRTQVRDVVDGLSNTILMTGVQQQLGSWASGGSATVRGLAREPYVNGPDGLGTGQVRGMLVLMADGSVREVSADTAPAVVRQMVTIADDRKLPAGRTPDTVLPDAPTRLPVNPPGSPTRLPPAPEVAAKLNDDVLPIPFPPAAPPELPPNAKRLDAKRLDAKQAEKGIPPVRKPRIIVEPVVPRDPAIAKQPVRRNDADRALRVKLLRYQRDVAMPLKTVLDEIAEMSGVDIICEPGALGGPGMERLETKITLDLGVVTIRDVLATALQKADLTFKVVNGQVHVVLPSDSP